MGATAPPDATRTIVMTYLHAAQGFLDSLQANVVDGEMTLGDWIDRVQARLDADAKRGLEATVADIVGRADDVEQRYTP